jgi:hypothetical protein
VLAEIPMRLADVRTRATARCAMRDAAQRWVNRRAAFFASANGAALVTAPRTGWSRHGALRSAIGTLECTRTAHWNARESAAPSVHRATGWSSFKPVASCGWIAPRANFGRSTSGTSGWSR